MFFRSRQVLFMVLLCSLIGCSRWFNDPGPKSTPATFKEDKKCLSEIPAVLKEVSLGNASSARVEGIFNCSASSLQKFLQYTRGQKGEVYSPQELKIFLEKYFLQNTVISERLLVSAMLLKQSFLGGSATELTKDELERAIQILMDMKISSLDALPHIHNVIAVNLPTPEAYLEIQKLSAIASALAEKLGAQIQAYGKPFSWITLAEVLEETAYPTFRTRYLPFLQSSRLLLSGTKFNASRATADIQPSEWKQLLTSASQILPHYLSWKYIFSPHYDSLTRDLDFMDKWTQDLFAFVGTIVKRHSQSTITLETVAAVVEGLDKARWLPSDLTSQEINPSLQSITQKLLNGNRTDKLGISDVTVTNLKENFRQWLSRQRILDKLVRTQGTRLTASWWVRRAQDTPSDELAQIMKRLRPLHGEEGLTNYMDESLNSRAYSYHGLSVQNLIYSFSKLIFQGYASPSQRQLDFPLLTEDEWQQFYNDWRAIGLKLKLMDPRNKEAGRRSFQEANVFTFAGNGDQRLSLDESVDFFSFSFSGKAVSQRIFDRAAETCGKSPPNEFGFETIDSTCFHRVFELGFEYFFAHLPNLVKYVRSLNPKDYGRFMNQVDDILVRKNTTRIESNDVDSLAVLLQYLESIFIQYDTDSNGYLTRPEAEKAFLTFRSSLAHLIKSDHDIVTKAVFFYMLTFGAPPDEGFDGMKKLVLWGVFKPWKFNADRATVLGIFNSISHRYN